METVLLSQPSTDRDW